MGTPVKCEQPRTQCTSDKLRLEYRLTEYDRNYTA